MLSGQRSWSTPAWVGAGLLVTAFMLLIPWPGSVGALFATEPFTPHGAVYGGSPGLMWLNVGLDVLIGLAYVGISATLAYLVHRARHDIPFHWVFLAFGAFIVACGATHLVETLTMWLPVYWLAANVKVVTAVASVATAAALPPLVPKALALVEAAKRSERDRLELARVNRELLAEVAARERAEAELRALNGELETRVAARTAELEAATAALRDAVRARDDFLAVAAHELKTPVTSLRGYAQLLGRRFDTGVEVEPRRFRDAIRSMDRQTERLGRLVGQLLDVSRLAGGRLVLEVSPTDLVPLVADAVQRTQSLTERHRLRLATPDRLPATVDPLRVEQIVTNLLDNAVRYSPDGGEIDVALSTPAPDRVLLSVRDRGEGIPPARRAGLFERYYQAHADGHRGGMGLGLSICREIAELHGGRLWAEFPDDGGSRFCLELPVTATA